MVFRNKKTKKTYTATKNLLYCDTPKNSVSPGKTAPVPKPGRFPRTRMNTGVQGVLHRAYKIKYINKENFFALLKNTKNSALKNNC